jgi:hypothetical protein
MDIQKETNYELFVSPNWQRKISKKHVEKLAASMKDEDESIGMSTAIIVKKLNNGTYLILDGQHRFLARKSINLPIFFMVAEDGTWSAEKVAKINAQSMSWKMEDYARSYKARNKDSYTWLVDLVDKYQLTFQVYQIINGQDHVSYSDFKNGKFEVSQDKRELFERFLADLDKVEHDTTYYFIHAFWKVWNHPSFDIDRYIRASEKNPPIPIGNLEECVKRILAVYNFRLSKKIVVMMPEPKKRGRWHYG